MHILNESRLIIDTTSLSFYFSDLCERNIRSPPITSERITHTLIIILRSQSWNDQFPFEDVRLPRLSNPDYRQRDNCRNRQIHELFLAGSLTFGPSVCV